MGNHSREMPATGTGGIARVLDAFYATLSGRADETRDWGAFRRLFHPEARLASCATSPAELPPMRSVEEYISRLRGFLAERDFFERGLDYRIFVSGRIACVHSRYEAFWDADVGKPIKTGTNLVTFVLAEGAWRIASMVWQDDAPPR